MITKGIKDLCFEAEKQIETLSVDQVMQENADPEVLLVDIRDIRELWREGTIPGSIHAPRGMLEFWVDPESPYHRKDFSSGKKFIFFLSSTYQSNIGLNKTFFPITSNAGLSIIPLSKSLEQFTNVLINVF